MFRASSATAGRPGCSGLDRYVGGRIRERRVMLGLTQRQMAGLSGLSEDRVSRYEGGGAQMSASRLERIARVLRVDVNYFFEGWPARAMR